MIYLAIILIFISHACKGICDKLQFHYTKSIFSTFNNQLFWNPKQSWKNKWKVDDTNNVLKPLQEKFIGSSTFFVWTTDAWHLFQTIQYWTIRLALLIVIYIAFPSTSLIILTVIFIGIWCIQALGFHSTYSLLTKKR